MPARTTSGLLQLFSELSLASTSAIASSSRSAAPAATRSISTGLRQIGNGRHCSALASSSSSSSSSAAWRAEASSSARVGGMSSSAQRRTYASEASARITLGTLSPAQPRKNSTRVGRGPGSGRGGTSGRGHKGQKARAGNGKPTPGFEGGQTPIMRRFPKRGFTNIHANDYAPVNLARIQAWVNRGRLDASRPISAAELLHSRCIHNARDGVVLLGGGRSMLPSSPSSSSSIGQHQPLHLVVSRASPSAIEAVEQAGGSVETRYYNRLALRALLKPHKWLEAGKPLPRAALPTKKRDLLYYASPNNRGYLAKRAIGATLLAQPDKLVGAAAKQQQQQEQGEATPAPSPSA